MSVRNMCISPCRQKEAAAASRKDSKLKAVVISEAWDKKSSKYNSPSLPFPFNCKTTYEQSMRTPMGREFNTTAAHRLVLTQCNVYPSVYTSLSKLETKECLCQQLFGQQACAGVLADNALRHSSLDVLVQQHWL